MRRLRPSGRISRSSSGVSPPESCAYAAPSPPDGAGARYVAGGTCGSSGPAERRDFQELGGDRPGQGLLMLSFRLNCMDPPPPAMTVAMLRQIKWTDAEPGQQLRRWQLRRQQHLSSWQPAVSAVKSTSRAVRPQPHSPQEEGLAHQQRFVWFYGS